MRLARQAVFVLVQAAVVAGAQAQVAAPDTTPVLTLEERVRQLDQELRVLTRLRELERDSLAAAAKSHSTATAGREGFALRSADGQYELRLRGFVQGDGRFFAGGRAEPGTNTFLVRRASPIVEATVGAYFNVRLMPELAGGEVKLLDAYWEGRFARALVLRAGKFQPAVGLERSQGSTQLALIERALPNNLSPVRDIGLQVSGDVGGLVTYQVGVFNGAADLANVDGDLDDAKDFTARVIATPFRRGWLRGLGFGVAGTTGIERGSVDEPALAEYHTGGQQTLVRYRADGTAAGTAFADGRRSRLAPQAYLFTGPLGVLGEYSLSSQEVRRDAALATLRHRAWQVTGSCFLTGEHASFRSAAPKRPFNPTGHGWGALELAARYNEFTADEAAFPIFANPANSARRARAWAVGANWYLARAVKIAVNYEQTTFAGGAAAGDRDKERFLVTRLQHAF